MRQALGTDDRGTSDGVAARGFVNGRGPRLRRGRDSTDRCVPARSPSAADHERACLLQSQKKSKGPKSPTQRSGALNYPCFYKIKVSKTGLHHTSIQPGKDRTIFRFCQKYLQSIGFLTCFAYFSSGLPQV